MKSNKWLFILTLIMSLTITLKTAAAEELHCTKKVGPDCNPVRIEQAVKLIDESHAFCQSSQEFLAQAEQSLNEAKKLHGEARQYTKNLKIHAPLLRGKALNDAKKQFQVDLAQFSKHAKEYRLHTDAVRNQFGHCKASLEAYEKFKKELELHCDQFHMPNIEPPHICLELGTSVEEAKSMQNKVTDYARRVAEAEKQLMEAESRLNKAAKMSDAVDGIVRTKTELALKEQDLAAEFARLREEHRQLDVARRAIQRSSAKVSVPRVHGKVKTK